MQVSGAVDTISAGRRAPVNHVRDDDVQAGAVGHRRVQAVHLEQPGLLAELRHGDISRRERLFTADEATRPPASLAARFAAKEAMAKALGAPVGMAWHDAEIVSEETGRPRFEIRGTVAARAEALGVAHVHVSLSHDAGIASAVVVLES